ncbi:MAG TPA: M23 family metallopeptidase [Dehalococcoidia bacterium]|nr:M23 family metallopeptidase [Dehalococcoidia bacterium]
MQQSTRARVQRATAARSVTLLALLLAGILLVACTATPAEPAQSEPRRNQLTVDEILALEDDGATRPTVSSTPEGTEPSDGLPTEESLPAETAPPPATPASDSEADLVPSIDEALIFVEPQQVRQGSSFLIAVDSAAAGAASVAFAGEFFSFVREGDRLFTILPIEANATPGPLSFVIAVADRQGRPVLQHEATIEVLPANWIIEVVEIDATNARLLDPVVIAEDLAVRSEVQQSKTPERLWDGFFRTPTAGVITSTFGVQRSYNNATPTDYHTGMDQAGALGELVVAPNDGIVAWVGETERRGRGVIIDHGGGVFTTYWHLSSFRVEPGAPIARGATLGRIGNTGLSTGPHLHWEIVIHGVPVDPLPWIRQAEVPDPLATFNPATAINAPQLPTELTPTDPDPSENEQSQTTSTATTG